MGATFLEVLWSNLYAAEASRQYADYAASGITIASMPAAKKAAIAASAQAFADAMVTLTAPASLADLQTAIEALKDP